MVVAVGSDELAATLDGQCSKKGIRNKITLNATGPTQATKNLPMPRAGSDQGAVGLVAQLLNKRESLVYGTRRVEHFGVRHNTEEAAEDQIRQPIGLIRVNKVFEPAEILPVVARVLAVGINQDVDVKKNHAVLP
jgi:hypothetical protein